MQEENFGGVHKILYVGDSITLGKNCIPGFRDNIYWDLKDLGFPFEFVGSVNESPPYRGFYFNSATTTEYYEKNGIHQIAGEMDQWKPTIVVVHLGTNDFWMESWIEGGPYTWDDGVTFSEHVSGHIAQLLAYLAQWHDGRRGTHLETILLCQIIPKTWRHMGPTGIPLLNEDLVRLVDDIESGKVTKIPKGLVRLVDQFSTFTGDMFSDDNHPNCAGYSHMASVFLDAFKKFPLYLVPGENGDNRVLPGETLPEPVVFRVTDGFGDPVPNVAVRFNVTWGDADIQSETESRTDSTGLVTVALRMGWADSSIVQASASGLADSVASWTLYPRDHIFVSGRVSYFGNDQSVPGVELSWDEGNQSVYSDEEGRYRFDGIGLKQLVTIEPLHENGPSEDLDPGIMDASMIARHVVGIEPLGDVPLLAADIDGSGDVTIEDAVTVARLVVGLEGKSETALGNWRFWPPDAVCDSSVTDIDTLNFSAIQVGDLSSLRRQPEDAAASGLVIGPPALGKAGTDDPVCAYPVFIRGGNIMTCELMLEWDENLADSALIEQVSNDFFILNHEPAPGKAVIAAFAPKSSGEGQCLVNIRFSMKKGYENPGLRIKAVRINTIPAASAAGVSENDSNPDGFVLGANYPNPFNSVTQIPFRVERPGRIRLSVYNIRGQQIRILADVNYPAGDFVLHWDGRDRAGTEQPSGIYLIRVENGYQTKIQRMELLR